MFTFQSVGFMLGLLIPQTMIIQYVWSVLGAGGVAGAVIFGNKCSL